MWGRDAERRVLSVDNWRKPLKWNRAAAAGEPGPSTGFARHLVFCSSMADVFEERDDLGPQRARLWKLIEATPLLTWQLLTKRPQNVRRMVPPAWLEAWPSNVWVGTTVEDQRWANVRVPRLLEIPAPVLFLSCEPLLGALDLVPWLSAVGRRVGWVIVGGESGPQHRTLELGHLRSIAEQCTAARVPLFVKQDSHTLSGQAGRIEPELWRRKEFPRAAGDRVAA